MRSRWRRRFARVFPENRENNRENYFFSRSGAGLLFLYREISASYDERSSFRWWQNREKLPLDRHSRLVNKRSATAVLAARRRTSGSIKRAAGWRVSAWQTGGSRGNGSQKFSRVIYQAIDITWFSKLALFGGIITLTKQI